MAAEEVEVRAAAVDLGQRPGQRIRLLGDPPGSSSATPSHRRKASGRTCVRGECFAYKLVSSPKYARAPAGSGASAL